MHLKSECITKRLQYNFYTEEKRHTQKKTIQKENQEKDIKKIKTQAIPVDGSNITLYYTCLQVLFALDNYETQSQQERKTFKQVQHHEWTKD